MAQNLIDSALSQAPLPNLIDAANSQSSSPISASSPNLIDAANSQSSQSTQSAPQSLQSPPMSLSGASSISAAQPSIWDRIKRVFTAGNPNYSDYTSSNPKYGQMQLVSPEAAMTPGEQQQNPKWTGAGEIAGSLTTPENVAIMAGTGGLPGIPGTTGKLIRAGVGTYFAGQMGTGAYQAHQAANQATDPSEKTRLNTQAVLGGVGALLAGAGTLYTEGISDRASAPRTSTTTTEASTAPVETVQASAPGTPVAPAYAPGTPADLVGKAGLVYKGNFPGTDVHQFEDAAYPGKTAALNATDMTTPAALREKMNAKLTEFGVDPATLPSSLPSPESFAPREAAPAPIPGALQQATRGVFEKYADVRAHDPEIGDALQELDNAPKYLRTKAQNIISNVLGEGDLRLNPDQERLFTLMADKDSRENLGANHPEEYQTATNDPAIQQALDRYKPVEQDLTAKREALGGKTLKGDYLQRIYEENTGSLPSGPRRIGIQDQNAPYAPERSASAEYHYENGVHELEPSFAGKYVGTNMRLLYDKLVDNFQEKATKLERGLLPDTISYGGREYTAPDLSPTAKPFGRPNDYSKFDTGDGMYLGPKTVVKALRDYEPFKMKEPGFVATKLNAARNFMQEQVFFGAGGVFHKLNIIRRTVSESTYGVLDPRGYANAYKVAFDKELKARGINGLNDPAVDSLMKNGGMTPKEQKELTRYWGRNFNPLNWAKSSKESLFGAGGMDQRARIWLADTIRAHRPDLSDAAISREVNTRFGNYNRANWTGFEKGLSHFMFFPGWDMSSMHYALQNPAKSAIAPALLTLMANQIIHASGKQSDPEDAYDPFAIHYGDHAVSTSLLREPMTIHLVKPLWNAAIAKAQGRPDALSVGVNQAFREGFHMIRPDLSGLVALGASAAGLHIPGAPAFSERDTKTPSKILPFTNKAVEKTLAATILRTNPLAGRFVDGDTSHLEEKLRMYSDALHGDKDARKQIGEDVFYGGVKAIGSVIGVYDYRRDAEDTLRIRASMGRMFQNSFETHLKNDPEQAMSWMQDPTIASYLVFHKDFAKMSSDLGKLNDMYDQAKNDDERKAIESARKGLLANSELENNVFLRAEQQKTAERAKAEAAKADMTGKPSPGSVDVPATNSANAPNLIDAAFGQNKKADSGSAPPPTQTPAFRLAQQLLRRQR